MAEPAPLLDPERVALARAALPDEQTVFEVTRSLHTLGEAARLRIVVALLAVDELSVRDLAATIGLAETATSQHLRVLRDQRILRTRRAGRVVLYALDDAHVRELIELALAHHRHGT